jgi:excisionase family DNA binding protein
MSVELEARRPLSAEHLGSNASLLDELMTAKQIADVLQMRVSTVEGYARRGVLPSVKVGRHRRFVRSESSAPSRPLQSAVTITAGVALRGTRCNWTRSRRITRRRNLVLKQGSPDSPLTRCDLPQPTARNRS